MEEEGPTNLADVGELAGQGLIRCHREHEQRRKEVGQIVFWQFWVPGSLLVSPFLRSISPACPIWTLTLDSMLVDPRLPLLGFRQR